VDYSPEVPLPKDFSCGDECQFYRAKNVSSSDSEIDTSTEPESESDMQESFTPLLLSKDAIEKIVD
jgi:hypothetical protein